MHYFMSSIFWYATEDADEKSHGERESADPFSLDDSLGMDIHPVAVRFIPSITPWRCVVRESIIA